MGLLKKLITGNKSFYKIQVKCSTTEHSNVFLVSSKEKDLDVKVKNKDTETIKKILGDKYCDKCSVSLDKLGEDASIKTAKKIYTLIEI